MRLYRMGWGGIEYDDRIGYNGQGKMDRVDWGVKSEVSHYIRYNVCNQSLHDGQYCTDCLIQFSVHGGYKTIEIGKIE